MRGSHPISRARRRGQALLLAVLIMIFAALISAAFIGVVATNLNQTARQSDKDRAVVAAQAGLDYVKKQLAFSAEGDRWRTELANVPPAPGDASYGSYYTPLEITQGWARITPHPTTDLNGNGKVYDGSDPNTIDPGDEAIALANARALAVQNKTGKLELIKSPDPRVSQGDPIFLSQVERIPYNLISTHPDFEHAGSLKITVIGLSSDDPTAWQRRIAYKGGYQNSPLAQTMRTVSNWDFNTGNGFVAFANPTGTTNNGETSTTLVVKNAQGDFSQLGLPFTITISNPRSGIAARSAVVTAVGGTYPNFTLTLAQVLPTGQGAVVDERVELAANLGAPTGIDYDNNSTTAATALSPTLAFRVSDGAVSTTTNQVDSARVNGGLVWSGQLLAEKLRAFQTSFGGTTTPPTPLIAPGSIQASSVIALESTATPSTVAIKDTDNTITDTLQASSTGGIFSGGETANKYQLISDGWKRLQGGPTSNSGLRAVSNFIPPDIAQGEGLERYRNLARSSNPAVATDPATASYYGYGQGIYIDNVQDKEKKTGTTVPVEMTQSDLIQMWLSPQGVTTNYTRSGTPAAANSPTASLEEQHLRGWVAPDEFRARGVEIELGNNSITITRDSRDDNNNVTPGTAAYGPVAAKAWKDANGNALPGVYRKTLPWPTNGVIFAEGNIRIKGTGLNAPNSLTVVSMNNIYIEDSLATDGDGDGDLTTGTPRKVLLMAKKNVVMNPTRVLGRPDEQTLTSDTGTATTTLNVSDASAFRAGDIIETASFVSGVDTVSSVSRVDTVDTVGKTLTVQVLRPGTIATGSSVRTHAESFTAAAGTTLPFAKIGAVDEGIVRRFNVPISPNNLRFAFNHQAARRDSAPVFTIGTVNTPPGNKPASGVVFTNKKVLDQTTQTFIPTATNVSDLDKLVRVELPASTGPTDQTTSNTIFSGTPTSLESVLEAIGHTNPSTDDWKYDITVNPAYNNVPSYYLAGVGNRYDYGSVPAFPTLPLASGTDWRTKLPLTDITTTPYKVPLATSIGLRLNNVATTIENEHWDTTALAYDKTTQFGFNPTFQDVSAATPTLPEDILTGDQSFYQDDANKSTIDSRSLGTLAAGNYSLTLLQGVALPAGATLPDYRLLGLKLEDVVLNNGSITAIKPGHNFQVNAYVYAQTGSWFVIPAPNFDARLHGTVDGTTGVPTSTYFDVDNSGTAQAGEYLDVDNSNSFTPGDFADFNRNGVIEDSEKYALVRYLRSNYSINFTGAIAENQTALVNDIGTTAKGAVASWMDKTATSTYDGISASVTNDRIRYYFDPSVAIGGLENEPGFYLPQTPDLNYVS